MGRTKTGTSILTTPRETSNVTSLNRRSFSVTYDRSTYDRTPVLRSGGFEDGGERAGNGKEDWNRTDKVSPEGTATAMGGTGLGDVGDVLVGPGTVVLGRDGGNVSVGPRGGPSGGVCLVRPVVDDGRTGLVRVGRDEVPEGDVEDGGGRGRMGAVPLSPRPSVGGLLEGFRLGPRPLTPTIPPGHGPTRRLRRDVRP